MLELTVLEVDIDNWDIVVTSDNGTTTLYSGYESAGVAIDEMIMLNPDEKIIVTIAPYVEEK